MKKQSIILQSFRGQYTYKINKKKQKQNFCYLYSFFFISHFLLLLVLKKQDQGQSQKISFQKEKLFLGELKHKISLAYFCLVHYYKITIIKQIQCLLLNFEEVTPLVVQKKLLFFLYLIKQVIQNYLKGIQLKNTSQIFLDIWELFGDRILLKTICLLLCKVVQQIRHQHQKPTKYYLNNYLNYLKTLFVCNSTLSIIFSQKFATGFQSFFYLTPFVLFYLIRRHLIIVNFLPIVMTAVPPSCLSSILSKSLSDCTQQQDSENTCDGYMDTDMWNNIFPQYSFISLICETGSSLVWLGCQKVSLHRVALKITPKIQKGSSVLLHQQRQKAFVTQNLFKHMVKMLQIKETESYRLIVMEYYPWNLADLLSYFTKSSNRRYTQSHINFIIYAFTGILRAVMELHQLGYVHRDLKLDNFMLDQNLKISLNDFELVTKELVVDPSLSGTLEYMAPQRLSKKRITAPITRKVDIWSLGIILYQLFIGETPYSGQNQEQILQDIYQNYINVKQIPQEAMSLIKQLLQIRAEKRPELQQIINSSLLQREIDLELIRGIITK